MTRRETVVGVAAFLAAAVAMAIDHLFGTDDDGDRFAEPGVFVGTALGALVVTVLLFRFVVRPAVGERDRAATRGLVCSVLAVLALPLLFVAAPFPFAGAGVALGVVGREGNRRGRATAAVVLGCLVIALGLGAYIYELIA